MSLGFGTVAFRIRGKFDEKAIDIVLVIFKELFNFLEVIKLIQVLRNVMWCGTFYDGPADFIFR